MQSFLGGGDKGGASNPLNKLSQREGQDRSVFRDRLAPDRQPAAAHRPFQSTQAGPSAQLHHTPHPFNLSHLATALSGPSAKPTQAFESSWQQPVPRLHNAQWSDAFDHSRERTASPLPAAQATEQWAAGFQGGKGKGRAAPEAFESQASPPAHRIMGMPYQPSFQPMYAGYQPNMADQALANGHAPLRSEQEYRDMEAAFERALEDARAQSASEATEQSHDQQKTDQVPDEEMRESKGELDKVWESLKPEAERLGRLAEWEKEFSQFTHDEDDLFDTLNESLNRDDVGQTPLDEQLEFGMPSGAGLTRPDLEGYLEADDGVPRLQPYEFASTSTFSDLSPMQALVQARAILSTGGSLTDAAHLLESYLQRATANDHAEAKTTDVEVWTLLGRTHAMNEKEEKALSAFAQGRAALEADPQGSQAVAGELLTNLAISYVNESLDLAALTVLHQFLVISHPSTAGPAPSRSQLSDSSGPWALHQAMTDQYLALARRQYESSGQVDPVVQVGLGTLYYMMGEYGEARGCWVNALGEKPDDYLLWNRLGATLANGGNPEEAVDAYRRALELRPTFTRAIFNLGVACLNIGVYREAAEHFLAALALQDKADGNAAQSPFYESSSLWATLRRALTALHLDDLAAAAIPGADLSRFRAAGFDF